jgi:hypothetical protein
MPKFIILLLSCILLFSGAGYAAEMTGKQVMEEQRHRHRLKSEQTTVRMILADKKGRTKERVMQTYASTKNKHLSKSMIKFLEPADIRNVGLLTWEQGEDLDDDQWLYLPALKKVKRISSSGKKKKFMGTDLTFEDLRPENISTHAYQRLENVDVDGHACYVIEALPATEKERKTSGYSKRILYVRKDLLITIKTKYFGSKKRNIKLMMVSEIEKVTDKAWRTKVSIVTDLKRKSSTKMTVEKRDDTTRLDDRFFTKGRLRR